MNDDGWFYLAWVEAIKAGRCPICATGNSHTGSPCPDVGDTRQMIGVLRPAGQ